MTAVDGFGEVLARIRLSDLAVYLSHSPEEIKDSFRDPEGGSLLAVNEGEIARPGLAAGCWIASPLPRRAHRRTSLPLPQTICGNRICGLTGSGSPYSHVPQQFSDVEDKAYCLVNGLYLFGVNYSMTR